jgi:hypothetical protein
MSQQISDVSVVKHPSNKMSIQIQFCKSEKEAWFFYDAYGFEEYFETQAEAEADALETMEYIYSGQYANDMAEYHRTAAQERAAGA